MDCKINWTNRAWSTYQANIEYLQKEWTQREISNFVLLVDKRISILAKNPMVGRKRNNINLRSTLVHKRILVIYFYKPLKNEIDLLVFWNTYQNPKRLKL